MLDPRTAKDNSILQCTQQKREESEYSRNFKCPKNKVARGKYYNDIVHNNNNNNTIIHLIETRLQDIQLAQQQKYRLLGEQVCK